MHNKILQINKILIFISVFFSVSAIAQNAGFSLNGRVLNRKDNTPLSGAFIQLLKADSSLLGFETSNAEGKFSFGLKPAARYLIKISFLGFEPKLVQVNLFKNTNLDTLLLTPNATNLKEVTVEGNAPAVEQKGDTTSYNASAFKVNPDATVEDLVRKMPGITMQNGQLNAQGEQVKQVLVDGKPFMGEDPNAALKNLPAEVVDKVQVFDQQSEQARFTGFNDGNQQKTLNIVTKSNRRKGTLGRFQAGYGSDSRYTGNGFYAKFDGNKRLTLVGQTNNINQQNFSIADIAGAFGGGGGGMMRMMGGGGGGGMMRMMGGGGGDMAQFFVNPVNGITQTHSFGTNFSNSYGTKLDVSANYFVNRTNNNTAQDLFRQFIAFNNGGRTQNYSELSTSDGVNLNHRLFGRIEFKPDSMNSIVYRPRLTYQISDNNSLSDSRTNLDTLPLNKGINKLDNTNTSFQFQNELVLRHRFKKIGRTLSAEINANFNGNNGTSRQQSTNNYYLPTTSEAIINQRGITDRSGWNGSLNLAYTEKLSKYSQIMINTRLSNQFQDSRREFFTPDVLTNNFTILDTLLSNTFVNRYPTRQAGISYLYNTAKSTLTVKAAYQQANLKSDIDFPINEQLNFVFNNFLPSVEWNYKFSTSKNLRFNYRTGTNSPSIDQLQKAINNSNPLQIATGNPDLSQDFQHNVVLRYSSSNLQKGTSLFAVINGNITQNYIGNASSLIRTDSVFRGQTLKSGTQITIPVNLDGYYRGSFFGVYSFDFKPIKSNVSVTFSSNFSRTPSMLNNRTNYANNALFDGGFNISSNISKKVDFTIGGNSTYNTVRNSASTVANTSNFTQTIRAKGNFIFWKNFVFTTDLNTTIVTGLSSSFNQTYNLLGLGLGKKFMKELAEVRFNVFDALHQNNSIQRNITDNYIEDVRNLVLTRYVMLTFTYNIRKFNFGQGNRPGGMPGMPPVMFR